MIHPSTARFKTIGILILLIALLIRLGWGMSRPTDAAAIDRLPDQREYLSLARNLIDHHSLSFVDPRFNQSVYAFRMPGYPMLITACGGNVRAVRVVHAVLDTSTVAAAGLLAMLIFESSAAGLVAAGLVAANPFLIYFSGLLLSDTLYAAMFAWALVLLQSRRLWLGTVLLAAAVWVRPSGLMLVVLLPGVAAVMRDRTIRAGLRVSATAVVVTACGLLPWAIRNQMVVGRLIFTTTNTGFTLYDGFHDGATGASDQRFIQTMPELLSTGEVGRSTLLQRKAIDWIERHPVQSIRLAGAKLLRFWSPVPLSAEFGRPLYVAVGAAYSIPVGILAIICLATTGRQPAAWLCVVAIVGFTLIHATTVSSLRYRLPIEPAVAVLASGTVVRWVHRETGKSVV